MQDVDHVSGMARTHGVLSEGRWEGATIGRLVADEVSAAANARQLNVEGDPDLLLPPKEAADLALGLHELATNATKHGAWSGPEGCVTLKWWHENSTGGDVLRVVWKETGGPAIERAPERKGFGSTLLQGIFAGEDGVTLEYEPDGLRCAVAVARAISAWRASRELKHCKPQHSNLSTLADFVGVCADLAEDYVSRAFTRIATNFVRAEKPNHIAH